MPTSTNRSRSFLAILLVAVACLAPAQSQTPAGGQPPYVITVNLRQSLLVRPPWPVARLSVTQPDIADVKVISPEQILVMGKAVGSTDLLMWSQDEELRQARIVVQVDYTELREQLTRLFPGSKLELHPNGDLVAVTGTMLRADQAPQLRTYLEGAKVRYVDLTRVAGVHQVHVKVKIAEVSRAAIRALGVNALYTGNDFVGGQVVGADAGGALNPVPIGVLEGTPARHLIPFSYTNDLAVSPGVTLFGGFPEQDFALFVQALAENQYLRILAEPNLVALSGEEASFLAGGEFPIPVVQGGLSGNAAITIEYKEYGVRLRFRPTVLGDGTIRMYVAPEVSELTDIGAVVIQGFRVPAIITRRAETTLDLKNGQTFGMAGLLNQGINARNSRIPGFGDIPILGALFRSVRYSKGETELVVLVTACLVEPMNTAPPVPGQNATEPNDWEFYGLGKLEGQPDRLAPEYVQWMHDCGITNLKGPGGWADYGDKPYPVRTDAETPVSMPATAPATHE